MNTAQDIVAYLLAATGGGAQDGEHHAIRQAVINGVREVMQCRQWLWHVRTGSFTTVLRQTTATVTAGSAAITVANPLSFVVGRIVEVEGNYFPSQVRIASRDGNTIGLTATATRSGTGVVVRPQVFYGLPPDLKDIDTLVTNTVGSLHCYVTPQEWQRLEINTQGAGEPYYYTIMRSDSVPNRYQVRFVGVPTASTTVHYTYRLIPQPVKYMGYERICRQGTVQLNAPLTVVGTGTDFPDDCTGAMIRFGKNGMDPDPSGSPYPFVLERRIAQWLSSTQLTVETRMVDVRTDPYSAIDTDPDTANGDPDTTLPANTKYAITDIIDCSPQMWTAILSACEMWYARVAGKPAGDAMATFSRDLRIAMENDVVAPMSGRTQNTWYPTPRSMGWHSPLRVDVE